ncbi:MAG: N-acetylmuramoyl-L-alanine amidase [Myxococcales bacterium]|nr:N-acetylmuramoyl-L-alanine amidase [Myxococcales bacterium]
MLMPTYQLLSRASRPLPSRSLLRLGLLLTLLLIASGCMDDHAGHHHIPPEVEAAAQLQVFNHHLGGAEYGPASWVKSPNYSTAYRGKGKITTVVVHTVQGSYKGCISWFQNTKSKVSAHYVVSKTGQITQMVKEKDIGWHVGSHNGYTVGIEHEGWVSDPKWATPKMVAASAKLTCYLVKKYGLSATKTHIKGHVELPNQTHSDPGKHWPWASYLSQVKKCVGGGGGGPVCPSSCDDGKVCTNDACVSGKCSYSWANGKVCWDGDACTAGEKCSYGKCVGGKIVKNCTDNNPCTNDGCKAGKCTHYANSNSCSDGNSCTTGDKCKSGSCIGGSGGKCNDGNPCTTDSCGTGGCKHTPNSKSCSDNNPCTTGDKCQNGSCKAGALKSCSDGNPCTTGDVCNKKTGQCDAGVQKNCGGSDPCSSGVCDPKNGGCKSANEGAACDDKNPCTTATVCKSGVCKAGSAQGCDDNNPCTDDSCTTGGCSHSNNKMFCDDGESCTLGDACKDGICRGTLISCDDGNPCTTGQQCVFGKCSKGKLVCDDGNDCTADSCDAGKCSHGAIVVDCDDGDNCTVKEYCDTGVCKGGQAKLCDDGDPCTEDRCVSQQGCVFPNICGGGGGGAADGQGLGADAGGTSGPQPGFVPNASPSSGCSTSHSGTTGGLWLMLLAAMAIVWRRRQSITCS